MNKCVLVTGSSKGLGKETIIKYAENNYNVVITYLNNKESALELKKYLNNNYNIKVLVIKCDITKEKDILKMKDKIKNKFNKLDVLVNNAGIDLPSNFEEKNKNNYIKVLETNLVGTFLVSKIISTIMDNGSIINISSNNAIDDYNICSLEYDSSKAGIINLTHNLANYLSPNIRVNAVAPGWINTESNENININFKKEEENKILLNRFAGKREIANVIYFLSSDEASYINDSIIKVDGGKRC